MASPCGSNRSPSTPRSIVHRDDEAGREREQDREDTGDRVFVRVVTPAEEEFVSFEGEWTMTVANVKEKVWQSRRLRNSAQLLCAWGTDVVIDDPVKLEDIGAGRSAYQSPRLAIPEVRLLLRRARCLGIGVTAAEDRTLRVWNVPQETQVRVLKGGHRKGILCMAVDWHSRRVVSGSVDSSLLVWDLEDGSLMRRLVGHSTAVWAVAAAWQRHRAVSGGLDRVLLVWDLAGGLLLQRLAGHESGVWFVGVDTAAARAVSGGDDRCLRVWDLCTGESLVLRGHTESVLCGHAEWDNEQLLTGSGDKTLRLWDLARRQPLLKLDGGHVGGVLCCALSCLNQRALSGSLDFRLILWDLCSGEKLRDFEGHKGYVFCMSVDWDTMTAITGAWDAKVRVWDLDKGGDSMSILKELEGHTGCVRGVAAEWVSNPEAPPRPATSSAKMLLHERDVSAFLAEGVPERQRPSSQP